MNQRKKQFKSFKSQSSKKVFNMIRLTFNNQVVQNCYIQDQADLKIMLYKIILGIFLLTSVIYLFYSLFVTYDYPSFWVTLVFLVSVCLVLLFKKYILKTFPRFLGVIQLLFTFYCTEYFIPDRLQSYENKSLFIVIGVTIAILIMINISILQNWIFKSLFLIFSVEYVVLRTYQIRALIFFPLHVLLLLMPVIFYTYELGQKKLYYRYYEQQQDLKEWKQLIDKHIPSSLFVITSSQIERQTITSQDLQIKFANTICLKQFDINQQQDLLEKLPYIYAKSTVKQQKDQQQQHQQPLSQQNNSSQSKNIMMSKKSMRFPSKTNQMNSAANLDSYNTQNVMTESLHIIIQRKLQDSEIEEQIQNEDLFATHELRTFGTKGHEQILNCYFQEAEDKNKKYYDIQLVYLMWEGELTIMVLLTDISEKVINERLKELDQYKDEMLNTITHDLKTPLNGILCFLEASQKIDDMKFIQQNIDISLVNGQLLQLMIEDFIDYSQLMKGAILLAPSRFRLQELISDVFRLYRYQVEKKKIKLSIVSKNCNIEGITMFNDYNRLKQVLNNLIGNAVKFTYVGNIQLIIGLDQVDQNIINFTVKDTGIGIPINLQGKLFKLFGIEEDNNQKSSKHGVGIGLTICQKLVEIIGPSQKIYLKSIQHVGSEFTLRIFLQLSNSLNNNNLDFDYNNKQKESIILDNNNIINANNNFNKVVGSSTGGGVNNKMEQQSIQESINSKRNLHASFLLTDERQVTDINKPIESFYIPYNPFFKFKKPAPGQNTQLDQLCSSFPFNTRILIVDDTMFNVMALQVILGQVKNVQLDEAYNGQQAIDKILDMQRENKYYHLVLMDVNMPIMDGLEATKKIRELESKKVIKNLQIYIVTAFGDESDKFKCMEREVNYHITKPVTLTNMIQALKECEFSSFIKEQQ